MVIIPIYDLPDFKQTVVLDGASYNLWLQWNERDEAWYCAIGRSGSEYTASFKLTNGVDLLRRFKAYRSTPEGSIRVIDKEKKTGRISYEGLVSGRFDLIYFTEDEEKEFFGG